MAELELHASTLPRMEELEVYISSLLGGSRMAELEVRTSTLPQMEELKLHTSLLSRSVATTRIED